MRTQQQIFDIVVSHLLTQMKISRSEDYLVCMYREDCLVCMYRGANNLKCAVGVLIPNEFYTPDMEGSLGSLLMRKILPTFLQEEFSTHENLLYKLQNIHDSHSPPYWAFYLKQLAEDFDLQYNPPGEVP